jgi:hypothetical protein
MPYIVKGATRSDLPAYLAARGAKIGAEVGVYRGEYSEELCKGIPGLHLLCIDAWAPFMGADGREIYRSTASAYIEALARLAPYDCVFIRQWSPLAATLVPDKSLDFIYLDGDHRYAPVVADLVAWLPKLKVGGIIAGHDYEERPNKHNAVSVAVKGWTQCYNVLPWFVLGRTRVRPGEPHEIHRTFLWEVR